MASDLSEIKVTDRFSLKDKNFLVTGGGKSNGLTNLINIHDTSCNNGKQLVE